MRFIFLNFFLCSQKKKSFLSKVFYWLNLMFTFKRFLKKSSIPSPPHPGGGHRHTPVPHSHRHTHTLAHTRSSSLSLPSCSLPWLALISENLVRADAGGPLAGSQHWPRGPGLSLCCCALMIVTLKHSSPSLFFVPFTKLRPMQACIYSHCSPFLLVIIPIFWMGKLRLKGAKCLIQDHTRCRFSTATGSFWGSGENSPEHL